MVAFRKAFPVLAIGAFLLGTATTASAQTTGGNPLVCSTNAGVPPVVRAEGHTELVGDIVIQCTGGNPALGAQTANFQLFLNTNITSRLLSGGLSEALLILDEAGGPSNPAFCPSPNAVSNSAPQTTGTPAASVVLGLPVGGIVGTGTGPATGCNTFVANSLTQTGTYNVFRAQPANAANGTANAAVVWTGIPIVPPGTNSFRTFRITNVRANAAAVPASASLVPSQIFAFLSISASQSLALNNPQQAVAFVLPGLQFDVRNCGNTGGGAGTFLQCVNQNRDLFNNPSAGGPFSDRIFGLRYREGFQTAFKTRVAETQLTSVPGVVYNTESGFVRTGDTVLNSAGTVGLADSATRIAARFTNLPEGIRLFVSTTSVPVATPLAQANALLVSTDANGAGGTISVGGVTQPVGVTSTTTLRCGNLDSSAAELTITGTGTGRSAIAVWEVTTANSATLDTLFFHVGVAFAANTPNNLPGLGTSSVTGSFAPFYAANSNAGQASSSLPIPRFIDNATPVNTFTINQCVTNLLFPFVTNQAGFDTGIAISNTSRDPFSGNAGRLQAGTCTINYYGAVPGGPAPAADTSTNPVAAGEQLLFVLSSGGANGIDAVPGFQGYIIAQCRFQYAHGFAFITDGPIGQARVAEGYLALVMDEGIGSRTGSQSEVLSH
ncbi:MAG TPA: hypothetical protein VER03_24470 [Bryobacteraceae bacterium]|nr:hypothetical protein [Bryobacteraceae bacterium]